MSAEKPIGPKRKRVLDALNHRAPDRVPVDFGGSAVTGMHVSCVAKLRNYYGLEKRPVKVHEPYQMLGLIEDDLKEAIGIDTTAMFGRTNMFGFENKDWKRFVLNGLEVLVPEGFRTAIDPEKGGTLIYPRGDTSAPPSAIMPEGGYFFDAIIRQEAFDANDLRARIFAMAAIPMKFAASQRAAKMQGFNANPPPSKPCPGAAQRGRAKSDRSLR